MLVTAVPRALALGWGFLVAELGTTSREGSPTRQQSRGVLSHAVLQTYIRSMDKDFVAATIQAIGRCATNIGRVRDTCLNGLVQLLSNRDGECVTLGRPAGLVGLRAPGGTVRCPPCRAGGGRVCGGD